MPDITEQRFGVEIEIAGVARQVIADAVAEATGGRVTAVNAPGGYDATIVTDQLRREWKVLNDSSIPVMRGQRGSEIVTPILHYQDLELLQEVVRKVRATGAIAEGSGCAVHVHVSGEEHTPRTLSILAKMVYKNEDLIFDALQVRPERRERYTRPMEREFIDKVAERRPQSDRQMNEYWFGHYNPFPDRYNRERYHGMNFSNKWRNLNTIEWRYPNSTLHAGKIKAYVQFFLALSVKALNSRAASHKKIPTDNPKFNFRVWLVATLGMKGDEFKTARYHLTHDLPGNSAWRHGRPTDRNIAQGEETL